ncbi:hypothetical protein HDU67_000820, partial [Dinochytrium kinnereticum]
MFIAIRALPRPTGYNEPEFCHHLTKTIPQPSITTIKGTVATEALAKAKTPDPGAVANERAQIREETDAHIGWITIEAAITQLISSHLDGRLLMEFNLGIKDLKPVKNGWDRMIAATLRDVSTRRAELTLLLEKFRQGDKESNLACADRMYALSNLFSEIGATDGCDATIAAKRFRQGLTPSNAASHLVSWTAAPKVSISGVETNITDHFPSLYAAIQKQVVDMRLSAIQRGDTITDTTSMAMLATSFLVRPSAPPRQTTPSAKAPATLPKTGACGGCLQLDCHYHSKYGTCPTCQTCLYRGHTAPNCMPAKILEAKTKKLPQGYKRDPAATPPSSKPATSNTAIHLDNVVTVPALSALHLCNSSTKTNKDYLMDLYSSALIAPLPSPSPSSSPMAYLDSGCSSALTPHAHLLSDIYPGQPHTFSTAG